jgi:hypothetical protein
VTNEKALPMNRLDGPGSAQNNQNNNQLTAESQSVDQGKPCLIRAIHFLRELKLASSMEVKP